MCSMCRKIYTAVLLPMNVNKVPSYDGEHLHASAVFSFIHFPEIKKKGCLENFDVKFLLNLPYLLVRAYTPG